VPYGGTLRIGSGLVLSRIPQDTTHLRGRLADYVRNNAVDETLFRAILSKLEIRGEHWDKDLADFSDGMKKKVLLARSLCEPAHLYLWDEPLNYVDVISRMQIEDLLRSSQPTMLLVEHDAAFLDVVATRRVSIG
jgi:lincosamide and streptogramin A transport system ATP-binding/permease protein